tara:strand:+ start:1978 stop:3249 length:1272 start_codon:yes stop_codon:yes gene_type:complete
MLPKIQETLNLIELNNQSFSHFVYTLNQEEFIRYHTFENDIFLPVNSMGDDLVEMTFTVKDIFNTYLIPTEMGSNQWKGFNAGNNARCITKLLWQGAKLLGKTVTSEFAVHEETSTINPWNSLRTCGTSSSGAAVNILLGESDFALATQTGGSIGRPASYCGVKAYKPTYGMISRTGVLKTCDPFDTIGYFVKDFTIAEKASEVLFEVGKNYPLNDPKKIRNFKKIGILSLDSIKTDGAVNDRFLKLVDELSLDHDVEILDVPAAFNNIHRKHSIIYSCSLLYYFKNELSQPDLVSDSFKETIKFAETISRSEFVDTLDSHSEDVQNFSKWLSATGVDVIVAPTTFGVAPNRDDEELSDMNLFYNYMHVPMAYFPMWVDETDNLPHGLMCISNLKDDYNLISFMKKIEKKYKSNEGYNFKSKG